ncbi:MAG: DUF4838 domain-containing protein [Planctomycetes bacterium]|nr:DUF4838 domain-containing protein [Planctomycetota bacterium]
MNLLRTSGLLCLLLSVTAADPPTCVLAHGGKAALPIVVAPSASPAVRASAQELAAMLTRLGAGGITVEDGNGSRGIVIGRPVDFPALSKQITFTKDPFKREDYVLHSRADGVWLLGASDLAVSHAVWDLLHRLGVRQYFPGATWEVVPPAGDLRIAVDVTEHPAFAARRIWYNWGLWGYNDEPYRQWCVRNRMAQGFALESGHAYEAIIAANRAAFDAHPEYLALVGGERKLRGDVKFCIANPGLRALVVEHALKHLRAHPQADSISLDPSDGDQWCECDECKKFPTIADRVVTLANAVGDAIDRSENSDLGDRRIGMYAYNRHTGPPTIRVHPRIIASATTAFIGGGLTHDQVLAGWQKQGATMGVYDYLSVVDWDWNLPHGGKGGRLLQIAADLPRYHQLGARFYDAESGDCWGPCGLGYWLTSRMVWDLKECARTEALTEDFLTHAFPGAIEPMRAFYQLINFDGQRRSSGDLLGRMYRHLDAARRATTDVAVRRRIDDLVLYTRHVELYTATADGRGSRDDVVRHDWRMRTSMMVHSYGLWCRLLNQQAALDPKHPLKDSTPFSETEISGFISNGITAYQPVDPGFTQVIFSTTLVPAAEQLKFNTVPAGRFPDAPQDQQRWWLWLPQAGGLDAEVTVHKRWANRVPKQSMWAAASVHPDPVAVDESQKPDGQPRKLVLRSPHIGLHRLETLDGGDHTVITWPKIPLTIESGIDTPGVTSHMRGGWTLSFYVPKGTKLVGGWASRIANWAPPVSGRLLDGGGNVALDFTGRGDGWFTVPVPVGQDGKLWTFVDTQGQRLLMTVPPYLARSGEELLLPVEVVESDAR